MAAKPKTPDEAADHFQSFLCAGIADLCLLGGATTDTRSRKGTRGIERVLGPGPIPGCADLALYLLLVTRGLQPLHVRVFPQRKRLTSLLQRVYRSALTAWDTARHSDARTGDRILKDVESVHPAVEALARFADKRLGGLSEYSLRDFGVKDVHAAMVRLSGKMAVTIAQKAAKAPKQVDGVLGGAMLVAATAGLPEGAGGYSRGTLVRAGVRTALAKMSGTAPAGQQELRRYMKRLGKLTGVSGRQS
jgi:hypothetical protein